MDKNKWKENTLQSENLSKDCPDNLKVTVYSNSYETSITDSVKKVEVTTFKEDSNYRLLVFGQ